MAGSVNKAILIGHLGKDPESRSLQNGGKVVSFSIATSESWKDKNSGERQERTRWHNFAIFNEGTAGVAERYLKKGSNVHIEGQIETRKWQDRYTTEIVLKPFRGELTLLDSKREDAGQGGYDAGRDYRALPSTNSSTGQSSRIDDLEDEIPFLDRIPKTKEETYGGFLDGIEPTGQRANTPTRNGGRCSARG